MGMVMILKNKYAILGVIFAIIGCVVFVMFTISNSEYERAYMNNNQRIGTLMDDVSKLESFQVRVDEHEVAISNDLLSCVSVGRRVAELQTEFREVSIQNFVTEESTNHWIRIASDLLSYFEKDGGHHQNPWFVCSAVNLEYHPNYTWEFQSLYSFTENEIDAVWLCWTDDTHELLAYTTGLYNVDTGLFSNIKTGVTTLGAYYQALSAVDGDVGSNGLNIPDDIMPTMPSLDDLPENPTTPPRDTPSYSELENASKDNQ